MPSSGIRKAGQFFRKLKSGAQRTGVPRKFASVEICLRLLVAQRTLVCYRCFGTASYSFPCSRVGCPEKRRFQVHRDKSMIYGVRLSLGHKVGRASISGHRTGACQYGSEHKERGILRSAVCLLLASQGLYFVKLVNP